MQLIAINRLKALVSTYFNMSFIHVIIQQLLQSSVSHDPSEIINMLI